MQRSRPIVTVEDAALRQSEFGQDFGIQYMHNSLEETFYVPFMPMSELKCLILF
jgi:hypothetical protein